MVDHPGKFLSISYDAVNSAQHLLSANLHPKVWLHPVSVQPLARQFQLKLTNAADALWRKLHRLGAADTHMNKKGPLVGDLCSRRERRVKKPVLDYAALDSNFLFSFCSI